MRSKSRPLCLFAAIATFAAAPLLAQSQTSHSGGGSHSAVSRAPSFSGGRQMTGTQSNGNAQTANGNHHPRNRPYRYGYGYGWGTPYNIPSDEEYDQLEGRGTFEHAQAPEQPDNRVGPTIFEHNGPAAAADSNTPGLAYRRPSVEESPESASSLDDSPNPTVLVFRDGHQQEVANYAIAGTRLIVLGSKTQKILLTDLDLNATMKANADRGLEFKMPQS